MSQERGPRSARDINKHWQSLAERRRLHLLDLYRSGRWRRYYTEDQIRSQMREVMRAIEGWSALTGQPPQHTDDDWRRPLGEAAE